MDGCNDNDDDDNDDGAAVVLFPVSVPVLSFGLPQPHMSWTGGTDSWQTAESGEYTDRMALYI